MAMGRVTYPYWVKILINCGAFIIIVIITGPNIAIDIIANTVFLNIMFKAYTPFLH